MVDLQAPKEESLDPENWDELRALGHKMLDDMIDYQRDSAKTEIGLKLINEIEKASKDICIPLPEKGEGEQKVFEVYQRSIKPYEGSTLHPRFWGAVLGTGSTYGMLAGMLTAGLNGVSEMHPFISGYVNKQALNWIKEMLDYPKEAGGIFVSGGSEANFTALAVARNATSKIDMKEEGMQGVSEKMIIYVSDSGHHCLERSVDLLG